jgi:hypothetical protein
VERERRPATSTQTHALEPGPSRAATNIRQIKIFLLPKDTNGATGIIEDRSEDFRNYQRMAQDSQGRETLTFH